MKFFIGIAAFSACTNFAYGQISSFDCDGSSELVGLIESGVDDATRVISNLGMSFVYGTIGGWVCLPQPLEMTKNGIAYLENITCHFSNNEVYVTDNDFAEAGQVFQRGVRDLFSCFGEKILNTAPVVYTNESRGEHVIMHLDIPVFSSFDSEGNPLINPAIFIKYGYVKANDDLPIFWELVISPTGSR